MSNLSVEEIKALRESIYAKAILLDRFLLRSYKINALSEMNQLYFKLRREAGDSYIIENIINKEKKWLNVTTPDCRACGAIESFVFVKKQLSQKDIKTDSIIQFSICKVCDPVMASYSLLSDGFKELCKEFGD